MQSPQPPRGPDAHPDVHFLEVNGREFVVVGTAHISRESVELVREVIERERPTAVCIELDASATRRSRTGSAGKSST